MVSLTDSQMQTVLDMARPLPVEKRDLYLRRISAALMLRGRRFTDDDVRWVAELALAGLVQDAHSTA